MSMKAALDKLFIGRIEQVRLRDLALALGRMPSDDEFWTYHNAGVFKFNYSLVYDYDRKAEIPTEIASRDKSDLEIAARRIKIVKGKRIKKSKPLVGREVVLERAARNAIDTKKYEHLDNGRLTMVVNNLLRAREKRGEEVKW